jgi:hypothetical protein
MGRGDHSLKVARVGSRRDVGKFSFANRTGRKWNYLPQELVELDKNGQFRKAITRYTVSQCGWTARSAV